jgi:hypothetical protein
MSVKTYAKQCAKFDRIENKQSEKFGKMYPHYKEWKDTLFVENYEYLMTAIGHI